MGPRLRGDDVSEGVGLNTVILAQARTHTMFDQWYPLS
jgi:hypothetical protein